MEKSKYFENNKLILVYINIICIFVPENNLNKMTYMTTQEMVDVMKASEEGKTIQCRVSNNSFAEWKETNLPLWDWVKYVYRVKEEPKYQPFTTAEEVFEAIKAHGDWLKSSIGDYVKVLAIHSSTIETFYNATSFNEILEQGYTFADGTAFGRLEE